jgi:hypothetical protein
LLSTDGRERVEKPVEAVPRGEILEEDANRDASTDEDRSAGENPGVAMDDG